MLTRRLARDETSGQSNCLKWRWHWGWEGSDTPQSYCFFSSQFQVLLCICVVVDHLEWTNNLSRTNSMHQHAPCACEVLERVKRVDNLGLRQCRLKLSKDNSDEIRWLKSWEDECACDWGVRQCETYWMHTMTLHLEAPRVFRWGVGACAI